MEESKKEWFQKSIEEVESRFQLDEKQGLSDEQIIKNRQVYGTNELATKKKKSLFVKFLEQFNVYEGGDTNESK